jgi:hypothetical protein
LFGEYIARSENLRARVNDDHDMASVEMIRIFLIILLAWCKAQAGVGLSNYAKRSEPHGGSAAQHRLI